MFLDNSRYALVLALGRNSIFATGITNSKALLIQLSGRGATNCLKMNSGLQNVFQCIRLVLCLI